MNFSRVHNFKLLFAIFVLLKLRSFLLFHHEENDPYPIMDESLLSMMSELDCTVNRSYKNNETKKQIQRFLSPKQIILR